MSPNAIIPREQMAARSGARGAVDTAKVRDIVLTVTVNREEALASTIRLPGTVQFPPVGAPAYVIDVAPQFLARRWKACIDAVPPA